MFHRTKLSFKEQFELRNYTNEIILLHSADTKPHTVEDIHRVHQKKYGMSGIAYHYFISKDGEIYEGRPHRTKGAFLEECNSNAIGVCFEGDFNKEKMGEQQANASIMLLSLLSLTYSAELVPYWNYRKEWGNPGANFPFDLICKKVEKCKTLFSDLFGEGYGDDDWFVPDEEWRHQHDGLGYEDEEFARHNAPACDIHYGNFNYINILDLLNDINEDNYWLNEDFQEGE